MQMNSPYFLQVTLFDLFFCQIKKNKQYYTGILEKI